MRRTAVVIRGAAVRRARRKEIARPYVLYGTGQSSRPCRHPAFPLSHPAKWVPTMLPALGRCSIRHRIPFPGLDATVLVVSCLPLAPRPCGMGVPAASGAIGRPARVADQRPARLRQSCPSAPGYGARRLLPGRLLDGHRPDACRHPLSIPFDVAVPIPLTRASSSTRRKGPCCRRYATIASARLGPTFASPCSSIDASAVLMSIRSAAWAGHINSIPSTSAFHETQGPTVKLLVTWKQCLPTFPSAKTVSRATYTQPIVHCTFTQPAKYPT